MSIRNNDYFNLALAEYSIEGHCVGELQKVIKDNIANPTLTESEMEEISLRAIQRQDRLESLRNKLIECIDNHISNSK